MSQTLLILNEHLKDEKKIVHKFTTEHIHWKLKLNIFMEPSFLL